MTVVLVAALAVGIVAALLVYLAASGVRRGRPLSSALYAMLATVCIAATVALVAIHLDLTTYQRLTAEAPAAELRFTRTGEQRFSARVALTSGRSQVLELAGDDWQIDARVIKWSGAARMLGLDTVYRLERVAGRYRDLARERTAPRTVHALHERSPFDVAALVERLGTWMPGVDAVYGSAAYAPMADDAHFAVSVGGDGLVARPQNAAARQAVGQWR